MFHSFYYAGMDTTIISDGAGYSVWLIGVSPAEMTPSMFQFI
jgi:hypothetical protein